MRLKKYIILTYIMMAALAGMSVLAESALALPSELAVGSDCGGISQPLTIPVTVDDPQSIAGAAFTLEYPSELLVTVSSNFFDNIQHNETPGTSLTTMMIAAANATGASAPASEILMTLNVSLKNWAPDGSYTIQIKPSRISDTEFGYSSAGESIDLLTSDSEPWPLLTVADYQAGAVLSGEASFYSDEKDTDADGYSDLVECHNGTDPETPTEPDVYDNYEPCSDSRVDKQKVALSAPETVVTGTGFDVEVDYTDDYQTGGIGVYVYYDTEKVQYDETAGTGNIVEPGQVEMSFDAAGTETLPFIATETTGDAVFSVERFSFDSAAGDILFCASGTTVAVTPDCVTPVINSFRTSSTSISSGQSVTLSWNVTGDEGTNLRITAGAFGGPSISGLTGTVTVQPYSTTTYTLEATGCGRMDSRSVTVNVSSTGGGGGGGSVSRPVISSFSADPDSISAGGSSTLSWSVTGVNVSVSLARLESFIFFGETYLRPVEIGSFGPRGSTSLRPAETTEYRLTASNNGGTVTRDITVSVEPSNGGDDGNGDDGNGDGGNGDDGEDQEYTGVPGIWLRVNEKEAEEINYGDRVQLRWQISQAYNATLSDDLGNEWDIDPSEGSLSVPPAETTRYYISAWNDHEDARAGVKVTVNCLKPGIRSFEVNGQRSADIQSGEEVTLSWEIVGAEEVYIEPDLGKVDNPGSLSLTVEETTSYTLTAHSGCGENAVQRVTVNASPANIPPETPEALVPEEGAQNVSLAPTLEASEFMDEDGDSHLKTRWQIAEGHALFDDEYLVYDEITERYLTSIIVPTDMVLEAGRLYYWRVAYFDGTAWSDPSEPGSFVTTNQGAIYQDGVRWENVILDNEEIRLGEEFVNEDGRAVNSDQAKAFMSGVRHDLQIGIRSENGAVISKCGSLDPDKYAGSDDSQPEFPYGLIEMALDVQNKGDEAVVTICFSDPIPEGAVWYKFDPNFGEFYDYQDSTHEDVVSLAENGKCVTLRLKDGGFGDLIAEPDGRIIDPVGFSVQAEEQPPASGGGGGGGGGGCFVRSLFGN